MRRIFDVHLANTNSPDAEIYTYLSLPATDYELLDVRDRLRLTDGQVPYAELIELCEFEELSPFISPYNSLNKLNALAKTLSELNHQQSISFKGLVQMELNETQGRMTIERLFDLAYSADYCHIVDATNDEQLGRFYAENDFLPQLDGLPDSVFELLDFNKIGKDTRTSEGGVFIDDCYILRHTEVQEVFKSLDLTPKQPDYQILLTLTDKNHTRLALPMNPQELTSVDSYRYRCSDCRVPSLIDAIEAARDLDLINEFAQKIDTMTDSQILHYKAMLAATQCDNLQEAISALEHLEHFMLDGKVVSPESAAMEELRFVIGDGDVELIKEHLNLSAYGRALVERDNAVITPYGMVNRDDYQHIHAPFQEQGGMEML